MTRLAYAATFCGVFLLAAPVLATRIAYGGGQPLGGGLVSIYITDEVPGTPTSNWALPSVQLDGNVINVYASPAYISGPTSVPFTIYVETGPLQTGDYQVNFYTSAQADGGPRTDYMLRATFELTVLPFSALQATYEYFNAARGHYFLTANPIEMALLDSGTLPGWVKTGGMFWSYAVQGAIPTLSPVCRFYGRPEAGLDSHFFTASAAECQAVQQLWPDAWLLESPDVFYVVTPDPFTNSCTGTDTVYRLFNNRADINHRYLRDVPKGIELSSPIDAMVAQGWILEGPVWCTSYAQ